MPKRNCFDRFELALSPWMIERDDKLRTRQIVRALRVLQDCADEVGRSQGPMTKFGQTQADSWRAALEEIIRQANGR